MLLHNMSWLALLWFELDKELESRAGVWVDRNGVLLTFYFFDSYTFLIFFLQIKEIHVAYLAIASLGFLAA